MTLYSSAVLDTCHMIYRLKQPLKKHSQQGEKEKGLCGRTDEQNGHYVSGRVEEHMRQGRRHSDGGVSSQGPGLWPYVNTHTHTHTLGTLESFSWGVKSCSCAFTDGIFTTLSTKHRRPLDLNKARFSFGHNKDLRAAAENTMTLAEISVDRPG